MKIIKVPQFSNEIENLPFRVSNEGVYVKYFESGVQAGFPSPADDFKEQKLSLDEKTKTLVEFKWVFPFKKNQKIKQKELIDSLKSNIENLKLNNWKITNDTYDNQYKFIVIHGIKSKTKALRIRENLPKTTLKLIDSNNFITLSSQYRKLFLEKAWPEKNYKDYE